MGSPRVGSNPTRVAWMERLRIQNKMDLQYVTRHAFRISEYKQACMLCIKLSQMFASYAREYATQHIDSGSGSGSVWL